MVEVRDEGRGHPGAEPQAHPGPVLHHQAGHRGHGSGPVDLLQHRARTTAGSSRSPRSRGGGPRSPWRSPASPEGAAVSLDPVPSGPRAAGGRRAAGPGRRRLQPATPRASRTCVTCRDSRQVLQLLVARVVRRRAAGPDHAPPVRAGSCCRASCRSTPSCRCSSSPA